MKIRYCRVIISASIFSCIFAGCTSNYYTANTVTAKSKYAAAIKQAKKDKWHLMLHSGINLYTITSLEMDKAKQQLTVQLDKADTLHLANANNTAAMGSKSGKAEPALLPEMHVYMKDSTSYTLDEPHTIILDKVARIERVH